MERWNLAGVQAEQRGSVYVAETVAAYDMGAHMYGRRFAQVDLTEYLERFIARVKVEKGPVLDAGCGSGRDLSQFAQLGVTAVGLDRSKGMLTRATQNQPALVVQGDLRNLPFRDSMFAGVWHLASLLHLSPDGACEALREAHRVLQLRGVMFLSVALGKGSEWRAGSLGGRRWFQYYELDEIEHIVRLANLHVTWSAVQPGVAHGTWINLLAERVN